MKNAKSVLSLLLVLGFSFLTCGCAKNSQKELPKVGDELTTIDGVGFDYDKAFFDDFTNGVDYDSWIISEDCWGSNKGGLTVKNLFYTDEGTVLFRANGNYYSGDEVKGYGQVKDGKCTGASLVSKFVTGPGRYQVRMKPMPRLGGCTAFWTYSNRPVADAENDNHEIDIELPGGKSKGIHSFDYMMNTNYITETYMDSQDFVLADVTNNKVIHLNDGNFHTFGFDWYTDPEVIVYYVDDVVTQVSEVFVPYLLTRIWVAVWISFSDGFMGAPDFETDFLEMDWIKYIPFDGSQPFTECNVDAVSKSCPREDYPTSPVSRPIVNKVANGDFEYFVRKNQQNGYGWKYERLAKEEKPLDEVCYVDAHAGKDGTAGAVVKDGGKLTSVIDSAYNGYQYDLSFDAISDGEDAVVDITYYTSHFPADASAFKSELISINSAEWKNYQKTITCPEKCSSITIEVYNNKVGSTNTIAIDNVSLFRK